jgi:FlaA1/EpsC-like NDP-sugar epimerase
MRPKIGDSAPPSRRNYYKHVFQSALVDIVIVFLAYAVAVFAWDFNNTDIDYTVSAAFTLFAALVIVATSYRFGVYQRIWSRTSGHGITVIFNAVVTSTLIICVVALVLPRRPVPIRFNLLAGLLIFSGLVAVRYRSRMASSFVWRWNAVTRRQFPEPHSNVLIIGAGESGQALAWRLMHRFSSSKYQVVGFIDDDPDKLNMYVEGVKIVGTRHDIERVADQLDIDLIVIAISHISGPDFREVLTACESTKAVIKVVPDLETLVNMREPAMLLRDVQAEDLIGRTTVTRHEAVDLMPITNKIILITGAAGSIGSELSRQVMQYKPTRVILLDNNESGLHDL